MRCKVPIVVPASQNKIQADLEWSHLLQSQPSTGPSAAFYNIWLYGFGSSVFWSVVNSENRKESPKVNLNANFHQRNGQLTRKGNISLAIHSKLRRIEIEICSWVARSTAFTKTDHSKRMRNGWRGQIFEAPLWQQMNSLFKILFFYSRSFLLLFLLVSFNSFPFSYSPITLFTSEWP